MSTPWHSINFPWGSPFGFRAGLSSRVVLAPPAFAFSSRQRLHWTGPVSCLHHTRSNNLLVWLPCEYAQRARCVLVSLSSSSHERRQPHLQRAQRRSPMFNRLLVHALPAVIHLRLHWTGPPAPLSRGILFPHPPTPLLLARSRRPAELHRESPIPRQRSSWRCLTVFIVLFVDLP